MSFMEGFVKTVNDMIGVHFRPGDLVSVKRIRKILGIPASDHSKTQFLRRALSMLEKRGILDLKREDCNSKIYEVSKNRAEIE